QNVLPFVTSLFVHASIVVIGIVFFYGVQYVAKKMVHQEEVIIPDASMVNDGPPGGVPFQGLGADPNRQAFQDKVKHQGTPARRAPCSTSSAPCAAKWPTPFRAFAPSSPSASSSSRSRISKPSMSRASSWRLRKTSSKPRTSWKTRSSRGAKPTRFQASKSPSS